MYCIIIGLWNQFGVEQRCEQVLVFPLWLQARLQILRLPIEMLCVPIILS